MTCAAFVAVGIQSAEVEAVRSGPGWISISGPTTHAQATITALDLSDPAIVARLIRYAARVAEVYEAGNGPNRAKLVRLRNCLADDGYSLDVPGDPVVAIAALGATGDTALSDVAGIRQELVRLERALPSDSGALIGRAKNLIEATCKAALHAKGAPLAQNRQSYCYAARRETSFG